LQKIAIIGAGIAGLAAARALDRSGHARVTLFEAGAGFGGHAHTVDVTLAGVTHGVDTGFLVFNHRTYPLLQSLFRELGVETAPSDMSFSVQSPREGIEWSGSRLGTVFAQRRNLLRPAFWGMLRDILRFNRLATGLATRGDDHLLSQTVGEFLHEHRFGKAFREWYLLPMVACIWSCPVAQMLEFPVGTLVRFCHNHGLLQVNDRPQWHTVRRGSREYVRRIVAALPDARASTPVQSVKRLAAGVLVKTAGGVEHFDHVVLACHSDQALQLLGADATAEELRVLGAIRYQRNRAVLHTDAGLLPRRRAAWAAWNHECGPGGREVCLHYLINRLQPLPWEQPVIVSLNAVREPRASTVLQRLDYEHPVFDLAAIAAQRRLPGLQGVRHTWFCGAWTGYGFHEDGLRSGLAVAESLAGVAALSLRGAA
jgi:predicted NAD/FAD-binding protein